MPDALPNFEVAFLKEGVVVGGVTTEGECLTLREEVETTGDIGVVTTEGATPVEDVVLDLEEEIL